MEPRNKAKAYLIAAPIGDFLGDLSVNAMETLKRLQVVFVEETETTGSGPLVERLIEKEILSRKHELVAISGPEQTLEKLPLVDDLVKEREPFAILSDKGLPCFLDPGKEIVNHLIEKHSDKVELIPIGASSALDAAIVLSGVDCSRFVFLGHFPEDCRMDVDLVSLGMPSIFYVRGDSLVQFANQLQASLGAHAGDFRLSVFCNIRHRLHSKQRRFRMDDPLEQFEEFNPPEPHDGGDGFRNNFTTMLHRK
jgi:hypothetical protein